MLRVLIGTVGYHNLRNFSIGPRLLPALQKMQWPEGVELEEMNWGAVAIVQRFEALDEPFQRVVFLTARPDDRPVGEITLWRWAGTLPDAENIQARIAEAVTGVISIDNLLVIGEHFKIWPPEVFIIDVAPGKEESGSEFTPEIETIIPEILQNVHRIALQDAQQMQDFKPLKGCELTLA